MKLSSRNKFIGKVVSVTRGAVNGIVKIDISNGQHITSSITLEAIDDLDITVGKEVTAIIKATSVLIGRGNLTLSARNKLSGTIISLNRGAVNAIVKVELPSKVVITSSITLEAVDELDLTVGTEATAIIKASEVLIMA
ncbi:MAG: TOBE domain-containing protein [Clostridium sp.]|nr:TOBE domain-containing protein [Clostridium sp.]